MHRKRGYLVEFEQSKLMVQRLRQKRKNIEFISFPYADQGLYNTRDITKYLEEIKSFIENHI
ncbi:MAG: hypothetical protein CMI18_05100 [Opitutaceae bacterium]|nr:hypothetical protein [Opitutaceae bacterium]|tara:strand:- start:3362 stop:3547 length:186 start_codon:yes stop_codon:yes gene_type:complete